MNAARPNPLQWLWYAYGGRLPAHLREWVLHDTTSRTWALRHLSRTLTQCVPALLLVLLPGPLWLRWTLPLIVVVGALYASVSYIEETTEHRLAKHGYPLGMGREVRKARREVQRLDGDSDLGDGP
ncbi:MAG: DUF5313 family protein [Pseudonocardiaceae bacterium]